MPRYEYRCDGCGQVTTFRLEVGTAPPVAGHSCGGFFHRQFTTRINWGGFNRVHPKIQNMIDDAPRRRDEYEAKHNG